MDPSRGTLLKTKGLLYFISLQTISKSISEVRQHYQSRSGKYESGFPQQVKFQVLLSFASLIPPLCAYIFRYERPLESLDAGEPWRKESQVSHDMGSALGRDVRGVLTPHRRRGNQRRGHLYSIQCPSKTDTFSFFAFPWCSWCGLKPAEVDAPLCHLPALHGDRSSQEVQYIGISIHEFVLFGFDHFVLKSYVQALCK